MYLKKIELVNFRNYQNCKLELLDKKNILIGKNAQGKSNLLEAIYYLSTLSSLRIKSDNELITWNNDFCFIKANLEKNNTNIILDLCINPPKKKILKVNGVKKSKYSQFIGNIVVVNFTVDDLLLLRGTPKDRRTWLDIAISQVYPGYIERLNKYNKIKSQRNNLLKSFQGNSNLSGFQLDSIAVWEEQLAITGSNIIYLRQKYLKETLPISNDKHKVISNGDNLNIVYNSTVINDFNLSNDDIIQVDEISKMYKEKFEEKRTYELRRGQTLIGPCRDDISFYINDIDAKSYASQGQQRTIVLSLKLAELFFIKNTIGENPILLLDDVLAELDPSRQNYLLNSIDDDIQTVITSTDILSFEQNFLQNVRIYNINNGEVSLVR